MVTTKFNKIPLSIEEKEKKAENFINFVEEASRKEEDLDSRRTIKENKKPFPLRLPETLHEDLKEINAITGISVNAICLELLRPAIKNKLRELKEHG